MRLKVRKSVILKAIKIPYIGPKISLQAQSNMLFVTPSHDFHEALTKETYTLVLSPHYYWCKKATRSFKNSAQAKKFASSLFDLDKQFEYDVYEYDKELYFVAFDKERIRAQLIGQGIDLNKVDKIYLAQAFFNHFQTAIAINDTQALVRLLGVVVVVNQDLCSELDRDSELASFAALKMVSLKMSGLGTHESVRMFQMPLMLIGVASALWFITSFINIGMTHSELLSKQEKLKRDYALPATSFQLKSMVKSLEKLDKQQLFIREMLHSLVSEKSSISGSIQKLRVTPKNMEVSFAQTVSSELKRALQTHMKKYAKSVSFIQAKQSSTLKVQR